MAKPKWWDGVEIDPKLIMGRPKRKVRKKTAGTKRKPKPKEPKEVVLSEREEKFLIALSEGKAWKDAGAEAGYKPDYVRTSLYQRFWRGKSWQAKIAQFTKDYPAKRKQIAKLRLPRMAIIEDKAFAACEQNPKLFMKHGGKLFDREYALADLGTDHQIAPPSVNIKEVQNLMIQFCENAPAKRGKTPIRQIAQQTDDADIEIVEK